MPVDRWAVWAAPLANRQTQKRAVRGRGGDVVSKKAAVFLERAIQAVHNVAARYTPARASVDAPRAIPKKALDYSRRGHELLDELGAVVPEAERLSSKGATP